MLLLLLVYDNDVLKSNIDDDDNLINDFNKVMAILTTVHVLFML